MRKQARGNTEMGEIAPGNDRQKKRLRGNPLRHNEQDHSSGENRNRGYSTVTLFARLRG